MSEETSPIRASEPGEAELPVKPGDTLAGRYRVDRVIGSGGMGVVVAATHLELGQQVALKFLLPAALNNGEAVARFLREARAAVQIVSEHVARVTDVGRLDNNAPYMVMEYLVGCDLSQYAKGPALAVETAVDFVLQACEAIAVAHSLGIVHRDLKPANLFLTTRPDGSPLVKVLDFGISKLLEAQPGVDLTRTAAVLGSPLYMSPEQIESSRSVDVRADVWALGTILHELLAGSPPFYGTTLGAVFAAVLKAPAPPLRSVRPDVPEGLERSVLRALEKEPARRFANVGELALALAEFAPQASRISVERVQGVLNRSASVHPFGPARSGDSAQPSAATGTTWEDSPAQRRAARNRVVVPLLALGVIVAGVLLSLVAHWLHSPAGVTLSEASPSASVIDARSGVAAASEAVVPSASPSAAAHPLANAPAPSALAPSASALAPSASALAPSASASASSALSVGRQAPPRAPNPSQRPGKAAPAQAAATPWAAGAPPQKSANPLNVVFK